MKCLLPTLSVCLALLVLTAGCMTGLDVISDTPTPKPLPDPPEHVTNETAREYVTTAEKAHVYNRLLDGHPTDSQLHCDSIILDAESGVRVAYVICTGGIRLKDDMHADTMASSLYWVERGTIRRVSTHPQDATTRHYTDSSSHNKGSYNIFNLDNQSRDVTVTLTYTANGTQFTTFKYSIEAESSVRQLYIPYENANTTYNVTIQTAGETRSFHWYPARTVGAMGPLLLVYVTPDGELVQTRLPSLEEREGY